MKILLCALVLATSAWGQVPAVSSEEGFLRTLPSELPTSGEAEYRVGTDDLLEITVFEIPELAATTRVTASGAITLPLVGQVEAGGFTPQELAENVEEALREQFVKDPSVTVFVKEYASQPVSLVGAVRTPGIYQIKGQKYLLDMLAMAQGLTEAAGNTIQVTRRSPTGASGLTRSPGVITIDVEELFEQGNVGLNIPIYAGDVINVLQAGSVFVVGELNQPNQYVLRNGRNVTVTQAVALGGGFSQDAKADDSMIIRLHTDGTREEIPVDPQKIFQGEARDVTMLPNDILFVPASRAKPALRRTLDAAIGIASGILIYSGR